MARPLLQHEADRTNTTTTSHSGAPAPHLLFLLLLAAAAVATVVVSLCTSSKHSKPWKQRVGSSAPQEQPQVDGGSARKQLLASLSGIGGKAAAVAKMVSWNRRSPPAGGWSSASDDDAEAAGGAVAEEEALWKKTIIMGDKCRPLEFSGHIAYDSDGNQLQPPPAAEIKKGAGDAAVK